MTSRPRGEDGSGTLWVLAVALVALLACAVVTTRGVAAIARHRAEAAADLAALAVAGRTLRGAVDACAAGRSIAASNAAHVTRCSVTGAVALVTVTCPLPGSLDRWRASATARAGPVP